MWWLKFADCLREYMFSLVPHKLVLDYYEKRIKETKEESYKLRQELIKLRARKIVNGKQ